MILIYGESSIIINKIPQTIKKKLISNTNF